MRTSQRLPNLVREHFNRDGSPKRAWATMENASRWRATHKGVKSKRIYECSVCGKWHLGGSKGKS